MQVAGVSLTEKNYSDGMLSKSLAQNFLVAHQ